MILVKKTIDPKNPIMMVPKGTRIRKLFIEESSDGGLPALVVWAEVDEFDQDLVEFRFMMLANESAVPKVDGVISYLDTLILDHNNTMHVYLTLQNHK